MRPDDPSLAPDAGPPVEEDRLNAFLDALAGRRLAALNGLDPEIAAAAQRVQSLPASPPDPDLKHRVWEGLMDAYAPHLPATPVPSTRMPAARPRTRPVANARAWVPPAKPTLPAPSRHGTGAFATAAFVALLVAAVSAGVAVLGNRSSGEPTVLPAAQAVATTAAPAVAEPATILYVGHFARLTAEIPRDWTVDPTSTFDYAGPDGFVVSEPVTGETLDEACATLAASQRFDTPAAIVETTWSGQAACRIDGTIADADAAAMVVPHPRPFDLWDKQFTFAAVIADPDDLDAIAATLDFSPDRVTPEIYAISLLDLVQARAYWSDAVDWPTVRQQVLGFIDGLPTVEMARQGILNLITQNLQMVGDNHGSVRLPEQFNPLGEWSGSGALVGGQQVLVVYEGSPAARAGVQAGDILEALDGRPFQPTLAPSEPGVRTSYDPAADPNRSVEWTVRRPGVPEPITLTVERGSFIRYAPPTGRRLPDDIGYIAIPGFTVPGQETAYAAAANDTIATVDVSPTCGWVVDLRLDTGGSYSPMATGVGPLLGNGTFIGWLYPDDRQSWVTYEDGRITDDDFEVSNYLAGQTYELQRSNPPVAVLTGPLTGSAGEVATLAFVARPETRLFGEPTAGLTTANQSHPLFDGTILALSVAAMTDRTGATHMAGVQPDEPIATDWTTYGTDQDPVLAAAREWLSQQPACAGATGSTPENPAAASR